MFGFKDCRKPPQSGGFFTLRNHVTQAGTTGLPFAYCNAARPAFLFKQKLIKK